MKKVFDFIKKYSYILIQYVATYAILMVGEILGYICTFGVSKLLYFINEDLYFSDVWATASMYFSFIGIWIAFYLFNVSSRQTKPILNTVTTKMKGNNLKCLLIGLLIGGGTNLLNAFCAMANKDIAIHFDAFNFLPCLIIFICVAIQSGAEEIICRGILYQKLMRRYNKPWIAIVFSSLFFSFLHIFNHGITAVSLLSIFFAGVLPALMMYYFDSMWMAIAEHTMWNYTQNIILGLPNSGNVVPFAIFKLDAAKASDSFFYDVAFGLEGSWFCVIMVAVTCLIIYLIMRNKKVERYDIYEGMLEALDAPPTFRPSQSFEEKVEQKTEEASEIENNETEELNVTDME